MPENNSEKQNQPPEDIFAGIDKPGVEQKQSMPELRSVTMAPSAGAPIIPAPVSQRNNFLIIGIVVVLLLALAVAGLILYKFVFAPNQNEIVPPTPDVEETTLPASAPFVETAPSALPLETAAEAEIASIDSDGDGLTDSDEISAGTNPQKADTDSDGLSDFSEVKQYTTDPIKSDSDGDSFLDGEEVLKGYNPKGPGKLLNFQKALEETKKK